MVNFFGCPEDNSTAGTPNDVFVRNLIRDVESQLSLERIDSNPELLNTLTETTASGGVDGKQYVV